MASFLLGDEYASSSSSSDDNILSRTSSDTNVHLPTVTTSVTHLLPSADELFSSDPSSSVLSSNRSLALVSTRKRKTDHISQPATKAVKTETGQAARMLQTALFAPPQLRRPNISTEDSSSWKTTKTLVMQRKAKKTQDSKK